MDPLEPESLRADVAVVGAGAAGLYAALTAASDGARVVLVSRSPLAQTASYWAQGGIAAALADDDTPDLHAADTIAAGRDAARESAVRVLCEDSPARVRDLERLGVRFDADRRGNLALGLEGGHSRRRIVHAGGAATGRRITRELSALAAVHERIEVLEPAAATSLLSQEGRCVGLVARRRGGERQAVLARSVILATGGMAALWERTTNPRGAIGAGMSLAVAAGAELADLEFMQFHPTALRLDGPRDGFLITEAVRGEGATLLSAEGERFVDELAPRDQVALAIQSELARSGERAVGLDVRAVDLERFPNIAAALDEVGLDPARDLLPVAPAAHYTMGGVASDLDGRSSLPGPADPPPPSHTPPAEDVEIGPPAEATRRALWRHAGLRREPEGLRRLLADPHPLARLIAASCLARAESRGAHQRTDAPETDPALDRMHTLVGAGAEPRFERWN